MSMNGHVYFRIIYSGIQIVIYVFQKKGSAVSPDQWFKEVATDTILCVN